MDDITLLIQVKIIEVINLTGNQHNEVDLTGPQFNEVDLTGPEYNEVVAAVIMGYKEFEHEIHYLVQGPTGAYYIIKQQKHFGGIEI